MDQENQEQTPQDGEVSRDDLIAAVREAGGTESVDVAAEEQAAKAAPVVETPPEEPRIERILREREKATAEREAGRSAVQEMMEQAKRDAQQMRDEARAEAKREAEEERGRLIAEFRGSPTATLRALGDAQEISDRVLRDGTPEGRAEIQREREMTELRQKAAVGEGAKAEVDKLRADLAAEAHERKVAEVREVFVGQHATREKTPYMHAEFRTPQKVFEAADEQAKAWAAQGLRLGTDFDFDDVAQYVERATKKDFLAKAALLGLSPAQQVSAGAPATGPGNAPKVPANGPRTLSAAKGSERRTSPKPLSEMSHDEERAALIEEVAAARRANPNSPF